MAKERPQQHQRVLKTYLESTTHDRPNTLTCLSDMVTADKGVTGVFKIKDSSDSEELERSKIWVWIVKVTSLDVVFQMRKSLFSTSPL
jgi:hypothetical protein